MGEMTTVKVMRHLLRAWTLPDDVNVSWNPNSAEEVSIAEDKFYKYLDDGWMAFSEEPRGRRQIFKFDPSLIRIILIPPLGGG